MPRSESNMATIQIATPFNIDIEFELSELYKRLLAYLIDLTIMMIFLFCTAYLIMGEFSFNPENYGIIILLLVFPFLFYTPMSEIFMNGQTIGKKILKIKVINLEGGEPSLGQYLLRAFLRFYEWGFVLFFIFWSNGQAGFGLLFWGGICSIIIISVTKKSQRLGDLIAGTVVVNTRSTLTVDDTIFMQVSSPDYKVMFPEVLQLSDRDINTIKNVLSNAQKKQQYDMLNKVAIKVQQVLKVSTDMYSLEFLEKIMQDYNYLVTKE